MYNAGLVCMRKGKGFKKGFTGIKQIEKASQSEVDRKLFEATLYNIQVTHDNIKWCIDNKISAYRVSSSLIPYPEFWDWNNNYTIQDRLISIGKLAEKNNMILTIHPDQFTVLASEKDSVIANSIEILKYHGKLCGLLGIEHIILHLGSTKPSKDDAILKFAETYNELPKYIQGLIRVENCHSYSIKELFILNQICGVDLCFDLHHERVINNNISESELKMLLSKVIRLNINNTTICHLSSGRDSEYDKSHADYISTKDKIIFKSIMKWHSNCVYEIEAKFKDRAVLDFIK